MALGDLERLKEQMIETGVTLIRTGLVMGTAGNISARLPGADCFFITPSGMPYDRLAPDDLVGLDYEGRIMHGSRKPSIEHRMHAAILRHWPDIHAVVHTHSIYATAVASARLTLPPFLETIILANGGGVPLCDFAPAGTPELAENAVRGLGRSRAVLLSNHGVIGTGKDLTAAIAVCEAVEHGARVFLLSRVLGGPVELPDAVVAEESRFFSTRYGQ